MKRRDFFKKSTALGAVAAASYFFPSFSPVYATNKSKAAADPFDLVAVKGGEPEAMYARAMQSLGGIKSFVKPNQTVVVKPNIGWDVEPERAANTNPKLVAQIIKDCREAGAKEVYVFDHTCDEWKFCYTNSGIEKAVKDAGGTIVPGNAERYYQDVDVSKGKRLKDTKVHELLMESDVFINVPVLKSHGGATLSLGMKNLMGVVWDRGYWHRNDLHQCISDFASYRVPDLTIIDGYNVMKKNGPRGVSVADVVNMKTLIASKDIVAADAAAAKVFGLNPADIGHIKYAHEMNVGTMDLSTLNIDRIKM